MLTIHRAARADVLADALADQLAVPPDDPFTPEIISVHSRGIERWLMQRLAARLGVGAADGSTAYGDGVAANVEFPFPGSLVTRVLAELDGIDPDRDPWRPARLAWTVLDAMERVSQDRRCAALRSQLDGHPGRRYGIARHLADLFDRYAAHRPAMIRAWVAGRDVDAEDHDIGVDDLWQAVLWRGVRDAVGVPSTAERLAGIHRLADAAVAQRLSLPPRLAAFGVTAVPVAYLDVLEALGAHRDVTLWVVHPSRSLWERVAARAPGHRPLRAKDPTAGEPRHPLTRSWGRDVRELQVAAAVLSHEVEHHAEGDRPSTLLGLLQQHVDGDAAPAGLPEPGGGRDGRVVVDHEDRSVQVHACWGAERQVEVLRDVILRLLAADPTLEPRDIVVMCPDIERYAPLVRAVLVDVDEATTRLPDLRVRLADRSLSRVNPVLQVVMHLLEIADQRCTAEQVLELAGRGVVQRRFRLRPDDIEQLGRWVDSLDVKWGLHERHRADHGMPGVAARTWRAALERLLVGVVAPDDELRVVGDVAPHEEATADVELVGRLAELLARLDWAVTHLAQPRDVQAWRDVLLHLADLFIDVGPGQSHERHELERIVDRLVADATGPDGPSPAELTLDEIRDALGPRLAARPSRANHRTGDLTICTLVPMRAVPHRVVCLLGMDDGAFPRHVVTDGDDLLERAAVVGDRDARTEDRQLLLDAVMSASETLVVTYSAHDVRTGEDRPPAVPVAELLSTVAESARTADGEVVVLREHPLQPHAPSIFSGPQPVGFDPVAYDAALMASSPRPSRPPFITPREGAERRSVWSPGELSTTLQHPIRAFVTGTLEVWLPKVEATTLATVPAALSGLPRWRVLDAQLTARLEGVDRARHERRLRASDVLPPGLLGDELAQDAGRIADELMCVAASRGWQPPVPLEVDAPLTDCVVRGEVEVTSTHQVVTVTGSTLAGAHILRLWIDVLTATLAQPEHAWSGVAVATCPRWDKGVQQAVCPPLAASPRERATRARGELDRLVALAERARTRPLPVFPKASFAYAEAVLVGSKDVHDARAAAEKCWQEDLGPEQRDPYHRLVLGGDIAFADLLDDVTLDGDVEALALQLWRPVLQHVTTSKVTPTELAELVSAT